MNERTFDAVKAIRRLLPHPTCFSKARWVPSQHRYEFVVVHRPIEDQEIERHVLGRNMLGGVASDDKGSTTCVGVDIDGHLSDQDPASAAHQFVNTAQALDIPVMVHNSKSGKGYHIRTLFSESVPHYLARALYMAVIAVAGLHADRAIDKVWPPTQGLGVLALPYNSAIAKDTGGTLALDPNTLEALPKDAQLTAILETEGLSLPDVESHLVGMGVTTEGKAMLLAGCPMRERFAQQMVKDGTDHGLKHMIEHCAAVARFMEETDSVSYQFWFGMMTNFKPFVGGREVFEEISKLDTGRYQAKELDRSWKAIHGKPRYCTNLDVGWQCPHLDICGAKSPAGLPFALKRLGIV